MDNHRTDNWTDTVSSLWDRRSGRQTQGWREWWGGRWRKGRKRKRRAANEETQQDSGVLKLCVQVSAARSVGGHATVEHIPLPRWGGGDRGAWRLGWSLIDRLLHLHTHPVQSRLSSNSELSSQMSLSPSGGFGREQLRRHFLVPKHKHAYTHLHEHTHKHSLAPPASVSRLIWCNRLCSRHSWSARVNTSCRTWAGRRHGRGTGGCRRTPPHDSLACIPALSRPPEASQHPSWSSPPRWRGQLPMRKTERRTLTTATIMLSTKPSLFYLHTCDQNLRGCNITGCLKTESHALREWGSSFQRQKQFGQETVFKLTSQLQPKW